MLPRHDLIKSTYTVAEWNVNGWISLKSPYYKEFKEDSLRDHDFNLRNLYHDKHYNNPSMGVDLTITLSYFLHMAKDPILLQSDGFNCEVHCIIECISQLCGRQKYYVPYTKG